MKHLNFDDIVEEEFEDIKSKGDLGNFYDWVYDFDLQTLEIYMTHKETGEKIVIGNVKDK